jgi:hypothetical protein
VLLLSFQGLSDVAVEMCSAGGICLCIPVAILLQTVLVN